MPRLHAVSLPGQGRIERVDRAWPERAAGEVLLVSWNDNPWSIPEIKPIRRKDFHMVRSFYLPKHDLAAKLALLRARRENYRRLVDCRIGLDAFAAQFPRLAAGERVEPLLAPGG